jgi:hypothetical protein
VPELPEVDGAIVVVVGVAVCVPAWVPEYVTVGAVAGSVTIVVVPGTAGGAGGVI